MRSQIMRTTLNIDDEALEEAMRLMPGQTRTEVINEALRALARRERLLQLAALQGRHPWDGDVDQLRKRA